MRKQRHKEVSQLLEHDTALSRVLDEFDPPAKRSCLLLLPKKSLWSFVEAALPSPHPGPMVNLSPCSSTSRLMANLWPCVLRAVCRQRSKDSRKLRALSTVEKGFGYQVPPSTELLQDSYARVVMSHAIMTLVAGSSTERNLRMRASS